MTRSRPSIAVLPFENLSPDPGTGYFARGFVEDLIGHLTRFTALRVIASQGAATIVTGDRAALEAAADWGIDYLLEGSVRLRASTLRVTTRLVRVEDHRALWSERFDAPLDDIFIVQDEISATIAGRLAVQIQEERLARVRRLTAAELEVHDLWLRGLDGLGRATLEGDEEARSYFRKAIELDPCHALSHAGLSISHFNEWTCQAWHLWDESAENALTHAVRAAELDPGDALVHAVLARVHRYRHEHAHADAHAERALSLNPNHAGVLIQIALCVLFGGEPERALELAGRAMELHPGHPGWFPGTAGWCHFLAGRPEEALPLLVQGGHTIVNFGAYRAACQALSGDAERAREEWREFEREYCEKIAFGRDPVPDEAIAWAIRVEPFRDPGDSARVIEPLRALGLTGVDVSRVLRDRTRELVRPAGIPRPEGSVFRREGGTWQLDHAGQGARLIGLKGFHDIARLLGGPEVPVHCLELTGEPPDLDSHQELIDGAARRAYRERYEELIAEIERAEGDHDPARTEPLRREFETLVDELTAASGLGGRSRAFASRSERARQAVTWRIRSAIKKIRAAHPLLGQHLSNSIRTGTFCVYSPERPVAWEL